MINQIKKLIENKIKEIGFGFNLKSLWEEEMISISFSEEDSFYFPTWKCIYYAKNQRDGTFEFKIRFSKENLYLDCICLDMSCDINILLD